MKLTTILQLPNFLNNWNSISKNKIYIDSKLIINLFLLSGFSSDGFNEVDASFELSSESAIEKTVEEGSVAGEASNLQSEIEPVPTETETNIENPIESELQEVSVEESTLLEQVDDLNSETIDLSLPQEVKVDATATVEDPITEPISNDDSFQYFQVKTKL